MFAYPVCLLLAVKWGLPGAAVGLVGAVYVNLLFLGFASGRALGLRTRQMWPVARLAGNIGLALAAGLVALLAVGFVPSANALQMVIRLAAGGLVYAAVYLLVISWLGWVRLRDWRTWLSAFRSSPPRPAVALACEGSPAEQGEMVQ